MAKLSSIYGTDENGFASRIASAALSSPSPDTDATGGADSKDGVGTQPGKVVSTKLGTGNDSRACVKGNHGEQGCND